MRNEALKGIVVGDYLSAQYHPLKNIENELSEILSDKIDLTFTEDRNKFHREELSKFDICILYVDCWNKKLELKEISGLLCFVASGAELLVIHNGISYQSNTEFSQLVGAKFKGHPPYQKIFYTISEKEHPILEGVHDFEMNEELYNFELDNFCDKEILVTASDGINYSPAVWVKRFGNGRFVYLAPGHDINSFKNDSFRSLIRNSALWVLE
jgi:uncharacterized protein